MIWLINVHSSKLEKFQNQFPRYAILSHTWGEEKDEIHFGDIQKDQFSKTGPGRAKFDRCSQQAKADGFDYVWIDTCCIDKSHHTDYSEAITSMFSWYQMAGRCYAYLADVPDRETSTFDNDFRQSRWHTRGWTLQELLAPKDLVFYSNSWTKIGEKRTMSGMIEEATGIPAQFLDGFRDASFAQRMSWAAKRATTRVEDMTYCLYGIFNVSLPIMYGEGASAAFSRLQEAILQRTPDASILAWGLDLQHDDLSSQQPSINRYGHILAASPRDFINCGTVVPWDNGPSGQRLHMNSGYYHVQLPLHRTKTGRTFGLLNCYSKPQQKGCIGIPLCLVEPEAKADEVMRPKGSKAIQLFDIDPSHDSVDLRIRGASLPEDIEKIDRRYGYSIELPNSDKLALFDVYPKDRWETSKQFVITGVDFLRDTVQRSWIRLRHAEDHSPDFLVMLELEIRSLQPQLKCHLMVASRAMGLDTIARESTSLPSFSWLAGRTSATNGTCNLRVNQRTKRQGGYTVYEISFSELERQPDDYVNITSEMELVEFDRRLHSLLEEDLQMGPKVNASARLVLQKQARIKYKETRLLCAKKELESLPTEVYELDRTLNPLIDQKERLQKRQNGILQSISSFSELLPTDVGVKRLMQWHNSVARTLSRTLPAQDADIESIPDEKRRLFMRAIAIGHLGAMQYLSGLLDDSTKASTGPAALSIAIKSGNIEALNWLLDRGFDTNGQDSDGLTPLGRAASGGLISACLLLLQPRENVHLDIDLAGSDDRSPLALAVINDQPEAVGLLLDNQASIDNMCPGADFNCLILAARYGRVEIVRLLLDTNAALEAKTGNGETALTVAATKGHDAVVQLLLDREANIEAARSDGSTPLAIAADVGHVRITRLLLDHGANTEARDREHYTPLLLAARRTHHHVVQLLVDNGADLGARDCHGRSTLVHCLHNEDLATIRVLLGRNLPMESQDIDLNRAMNIAIEKAFSGGVQLLLTGGIFNYQKADFLGYAKEIAADGRGDRGNKMDEIIAMLQKANPLRERVGTLPPYMAASWDGTVQTLIDRIHFNERKSLAKLERQSDGEQIFDDPISRRRRSLSPNTSQQNQTSNSSHGKSGGQSWKRKFDRYSQFSQNSDYIYEESSRYSSSQRLQEQHAETGLSDYHDRNPGADTLTFDGEEIGSQPSSKTPWDPNKHQRTR